MCNNPGVKFAWPFFLMQKLLLSCLPIRLWVAVAMGLLVPASCAVLAQIQLQPHEVYMQPVTGLSYAQLRLFEEGEKQFKAPWVVFPSLAGEWGLGPTFLATSCAGCHVQAGRGRTFEGDAIAFQQLVRLSIPGETQDGSPKPHPHYGDQIQPFGVYVGLKENLKPGEADVRIDWLPQTVKLPDGTDVELRRPRLRIENLNFGLLGEDTMTSLRNTQVLFGMGYLEAVPESDLRALAAEQKQYGLNGRLNLVRDDVHKQQALGRFGWKANQPSIRQQIAAAFLGDTGVTTPLYTEENCPPIQVACRAMPPGNRPELLGYNWDQLTFWSAALAPPPVRNASDPKVLRGAELFSRVQCALCHVPQMKTGDYPLLPQISNQTFSAFTDLLLHDMGEDLADGRPDFLAGPRDWRTAPLWGIGLSQQVNGSTHLLHDGRARNVLEAVLWHGGEAKPSREAFAALSANDRDALIAFVNSR